MTLRSPDHFVFDECWSDLERFQAMPEIDHARMRDYRLSRVQTAIADAGAALCVLVSPISLRYAVEYRCYGLFQAHIPTTYAFVPAEGPVTLYNAYDPESTADRMLNGRAISFFDAGNTLSEQADKLADDVLAYLAELGTDNRRVALEYVNPSITLAMARAGLEVIDGVRVVETARVIKSEDEIACMEWAIAVAEHGIGKLSEALKPGVTELQLWGLLNYTNLANNGDWHDGRMLASGPRINPWLQEASPRRIESGDLVGFDTDMLGPFGYCADVSRTFHCGPRLPTPRQKELYRLAHAEIEHNVALVRPGMRFSEFQRQAFRQDEQYHQNAYTCVAHAVGMCDEYPRINPIFRGENPYDGVFEPGMVMCIESYVGAVGEPDGVKLEEQVLITTQGSRRLTRYPYESALLD